MPRPRSNRARGVLRRHPRAPAALALGRATAAGHAKRARGQAGLGEVHTRRAPRCARDLRRSPWGPSRYARGRGHGQLGRRHGDRRPPASARGRRGPSPRSPAAGYCRRRRLAHRAAHRHSLNRSGSRPRRRAELADGPLAAKQVRRAARDEGISEATLRRAKQGLVTSRKTGWKGAWEWHLDGAQEGAQGEGDAGVERLGKTPAAAGEFDPSTPGYPVEGAQPSRVSAFEGTDGRSRPVDPDAERAERIAARHAHLFDGYAS